MVRGIERRAIFADTKDKQSFLKRLGNVLTDTQTNCYAYALMSNHYHLLLQTGSTSLSRVMQSLLTGYAVNYNLRHRRTGKLYQNRFKSILCDKEEYLLQLIRYIHLNPLRVGLVPNLRELDKSPWTGHAVLMGKKEAEWLDTEEVLSNFARTKKKARAQYSEFVKEGIKQKQPIDFSGGGLIRSIGGVWEAIKASRKGRKEAGDERILGSGDFVEAVLKRTEEQESTASRLQREGWDFEKVLQRAAEIVGVKRNDLLRQSRGNARSQGRALLCRWLVDDLQYTQVSVAEKLSITRAAVGVLANRGRGIEAQLGWGIVDES